MSADGSDFPSKCGSNAGVPALSVIIPVYNGGMQLARCLEALRCSEHSDFEVIVVDDCSTDNTSEIIKRYGARAVRTPHRLGPAGARNMAMGYAQSSIVVFVDADVVLPANALGIIHDDFSSDPQLAAVFGSYDEEPAWKDFLSQYKNLIHRYVHQNSNAHATTFWAGCGAVRKRVFIEHGGFDAHRYRKPSIEDIEFGYRLTSRRQEIRLDKRLQVKHLKRWTFRSLIQTDILARAVPWTQLIFETRRIPGDLNLRSEARSSAGLVGVLSLAWLFLCLQVLNVLPMFNLPHSFVAELGIVASIAAALVALNWGVYSYFWKKRGWYFAVRAVPVHWFYYLYSGVIFVTVGSVHSFQLVMARLLQIAWGSSATSARRKT